jgi:hypothetical protein
MQILWEVVKMSLNKTGARSASNKTVDTVSGAAPIAGNPSNNNIQKNDFSNLNNEDLIAKYESLVEASKNTASVISTLDAVGIELRKRGIDIDVTNESSGRKQLITSKMMNDFGWSVSDTELEKINNMLHDYNITDMRSIRLFMATCAHESGKGSIGALEGLNKDGTTVGKYKSEERGAGHIQITWDATHRKFLQTIPDSFSGVNTAEYIAENYPWEAAGWFWSSPEAKTAGRVSLNEYIVKYGDSKGGVSCYSIFC